MPPPHAVRVCPCRPHTCAHIQLQVGGVLFIFIQLALLYDFMCNTLHFLLNKLEGSPDADPDSNACCGPGWAYDMWCAHDRDTRGLRKRGFVLELPLTCSCLAPAVLLRLCRRSMLLFTLAAYGFCLLVFISTIVARCPVQAPHTHARALTRARGPRTHSFPPRPPPLLSLALRMLARAVRPTAASCGLAGAQVGQWRRHGLLGGRDCGVHRLCALHPHVLPLGLHVRQVQPRRLHAHERAAGRRLRERPLPGGARGPAPGTWPRPRTAVLLPHAARASCTHNC